MKVLVLGATGMLGHAVLGDLAVASGYQAFGTVRAADSIQRLPARLRERAVVSGDLAEPQDLISLLDRCAPEAVVNCTSVPKSDMQNPAKAFLVYGVLPQRLAHLCRERRIRLVQISSDGVFSGRRGAYTESDLPDASDVYGLAKLLGEVDGEGAVTIRTSMLGPELGTRAGMLEWFLSQAEACRGFDRAIFTGMPTVVLAQIIRRHVLEQPQLRGVYHVAAPPISKFELLRRIAGAYGRATRIDADSSVVMDRSLIATRFARATGYVAPDWAQLVNIMRASHMASTDS